MTFVTIVFGRWIFIISKLYCDLFHIDFSRNGPKSKLQLFYSIELYPQIFVHFSHQQYILLLNLIMFKLAQFQNEFNFTMNNIEMNFKLPFANGKLHIFKWELLDAIQKDLRTWKVESFIYVNGKQNLTKCFCDFPFTTTFVKIYWQKKRFLFRDVYI